MPRVIALRIDVRSAETESMDLSDRAESSPHRPSSPVGIPAWRDRHPAWAVRPFRRSKAAPTHESTEESRARLSLVLLAYCVAIVAVLQLAPFGFLLPSDVRIVAFTDWRDAATSLLLFVPLGFLYPLTRPRGGVSAAARRCGAD